MITARQIIFKLREEYDSSFISDHTKEHCEIFLNPPFSEMRKLGKRLRFLIPKDLKEEVYVWDAEKALHDEATRYLMDAKSSNTYLRAYRGESIWNNNGFEIFRCEGHARPDEISLMVSLHYPWITKYFAVP